MSEHRPLPLPDETSAAFWEAAREGRLAIQRCTACRRWNHAPSLACPACGSFQLAYEDVSGKGRLQAWTVLADAPAPGFRDRLPLIVGVVELAEQPGLLMVANVLETDVADLRLGMPLGVMFETVTADCVLPQFRPIEG
jgi:uncharacterized OB-fold protein